jgi:hypothetical protein
MKIPKKRGRPRLSPEEKARRKAEREAAKAAARKLGPKKRVTSKKFQEEDKSPKSQKIFLLTPSGKCPVELYGCDKEAIRIWLSQAKNCKRKGYLHTVQSLTYWLRGYFDYFSDEHKIAAANIKELAPAFDIVDYESKLKKIYESVKAKRNIETVKKYIETGDV